MWSFGICFHDTHNLETTICSIVNQKTNKDIDVLMIGPDNEISKKLCKKHHNVRWIVFDENMKKGWITLKKNLLVQNSKYENICLMHDYVALCENWISGFDVFGYNWDVCMTPVRMKNGMRHRDWFSWFRPLKFIPYADSTKTNQMYINGTYWCGKKDFMLKNPQNENLCWGQGEDVEWGARCNSFWNYKLNPLSVVKYLKDKEFSDWNPHPDTDPDKNSGYENCKIQE